ncbi:MAG: choice-of-anchor D domain-containing protein, partial [Myxococcaceae bacterium]|nr:choice-of-anchor D domain-containing protein [Myxococcaceae bacterium]
GGSAGGEAGGSAGGEAGGSAGGEAGGSAGGEAGGSAGGAVGSAALAVSQGSIAFANTTTGTMSAPTTVVVTNVGTLPTGPLMLRLARGAASAFQVMNSTCTAALGPGATCQLEVRFSPLTTGLLTDALSCSAAPGGTRGVALSGLGTLPAELSLTPSSFTFPSVVLGGASMAQAFTVRNIGGSPSGIPAVTIGGADPSMFSKSGDTCTAALPPTGTCTTTIVFTPTDTGSRAATLQVNASPGGTANTSLSAASLTPATLGATPALGVFDDTPTGSTSTTLTFTVTNGGQATSGALTVGVGGPHASDFGVASQTCAGATLSANGACTVALQFSPTATGSRLGLLTFTPAGGIPTSVTLSGRGLVAPQLSLAVAEVGFGSVTLGTNQSSTVLVRNTGEAPTSAVMVSATPAPFFVTSSTCAAPLQGGATCNVTLRFAPTTAGAASGTLTVSAMTGGAAVAPLSGVGVAAGQLSLTPTALSFTPTVIGQTGQTLDLTLTNTDGTALMGTMVSVGGSGASSFSSIAVDCPATASLPTSSTCTVRIRFAPQAAGPLSAFVTVTSGSSTVQATLSGTGLAPARLQLSPSSVTFPQTSVGQTSDQVFTVTNDGDVATGSLGLSLGGADPSQWTVQGSTCPPAGLGPRGSCTFRLVYAPTSGAVHSAAVLAAASPGGASSSSLSGSASAPALLTLAPAAGSSASFGNVLLGSAGVVRVFTLVNTGQQPSGLVSVGFSGANANLWQLVSGANACQLGQPLAAGQSCTLSAQFTAPPASGGGVKAATLTASARPGGSPALALTANAQSPASLVATDTSRHFGDVIVGDSTGPFSWVIRNAGDVASGALSLTTGSRSDFSVTSNTCAGTLAPMATCTVDVVYSPSSAAPTSTTLTVSGAPGGSVALAASGNGQWLVTVDEPGEVGQRVKTSDNRIDCPGACTAGYGDGASVTFQARTANGSRSHFFEWKRSADCGPGSSGPDCVVTISDSLGVAANFAPIDTNLAFVSSEFVPANLGGVAPYDARCNALASAAGINDAAGTAFRAWLSTSASTVASRLTAMGGWRRLDREAFASSRTALMTGQVLVPLVIDEWGRRVTTGLSAWTGTRRGGAANGQDCAGWTSGAPGLAVERGRVEGGPDLFTSGTGGHPCADPSTRLYCFQNTSGTTIAVPRVPVSARLAFVAPPWNVGAGLASADAHCNLNKPAGTPATFVAFLATTSASAASRLPAGMSYFTPGGVFVGTSDALRATTPTSRDANLNTGLWVSGSADFAAGGDTAWTGAACTACLANLNSSCSNWTSTSGAMGVFGQVSSAAADFFSGPGALSACTVARRVYCFQL